MCVFSFAVDNSLYLNSQAMHLADVRLLHENRDFGITELCLTNLQLVKKANEVDPGDLARYDQLRRLGLRWSRQPDDEADNYACANSRQSNDSAVLQRLQPHANLSTLEISGYEDATFCAWMSNANLYVPNLLKIELVGMPRCERLPSLGQLANLEELHISNMPNIREVDSCFYGGKYPFRKLRKLHIDGMGNLEVWSTNLEPSAGQMSWNDDEQQLLGDEIFPSLEHLIVKGCPRLTLGSGFQGCIRRIIESCSEVELSPGIFIGSSRLSNKLDAETNILGFSDGSELLRYGINLSNLTIKSNSDLITLPGIIQKCRTLRSLQILDCWNFSVLPDWLGDLTSLEELKVHAPKLQCLPHSIKGLTSLKTLTLKQCNYKLRERCSTSGEDYDKIEGIKYHVQVICLVFSYY
jgi:Leucine-rich repeat (LRR) protein